MQVRSQIALPPSPFDSECCEITAQLTQARRKEIARVARLAERAPEVRMGIGVHQAGPAFERVELPPDGLDSQREHSHIGSFFQSPCERVAVE